MRSLAHYCWRQGEMKGIKSKFSWDVPLYKLVLRRDSSANQEIMSSSHHKHKSAVLLGNNSPGGYGKEGLLQTTAVVITADKKNHLRSAKVDPAQSKHSWTGLTIFWYLQSKILLATVVPLYGFTDKPQWCPQQLYCLYWWEQMRWHPDTTYLIPISKQLHFVII